MPHTRGRVRRSAPPAFKVRQLGAERVSTRETLGQCRSILTLHALEHREAIFDVLQLRRRGIDPFGVSSEEQRQVFELRLDAVLRLEKWLEPGVERGQIGDAPPDTAEARQNRRVALVQGRVTFRAKTLNTFRTGQHAPAGRELDVLCRLVWLEPCPIEIGKLKRDELAARIAVGKGSPESRQLLASRLPGIERSRNGRGVRTEVPEAVDQINVRRRIEQGLMFVLSVQLDEACRQLAERRCRRERAVDEGAAATLRRDFAAHEQLFPCDFENGFDGRGVLAGPHKLRRGPTAKEESDGLDQDRLPSPSLAGEHIEPGFELDFRLINDRQMGYAQEAEHDDSGKTGTPIVA